MIYQTLNKHQFIDSFKSWDTYSNNFSYEGLELLYDWIIESDENIELDVVGLCCGFTESDVTTIIQDYDLPQDASFNDALEYIQENSLVVGVTEQKTIIYYTF